MRNIIETITKTMLFGGSVSLGFSAGALAADIQAGGELAVQCAACHGASGISTDDKFPNLAGQKEAYLKLQLEAFKNDKRKNPLMNAIAASLEEKDIENLAAHFASLAGAKVGAKEANSSGLDGSALSFPKDYDKTFTRYQRKDYDDRKQVRYFSGNQAALDAVKAGGPFPSGAYFLVEIFDAKVDGDGKLIKDADGKLIAGDRKLFSAMEKRTGWGEGVADIYKNGDWRYSAFLPDGSNKKGLNEAPCMACHKPLTDTDYTFTYSWVKDYLPTKKIGYTHKIVE